MKGFRDPWSVFVPSIASNKTLDDGDEFLYCEFIIDHEDY